MDTCDRNNGFKLRIPNLATVCLYYNQPLRGNKYCNNLDSNYIVRHSYGSYTGCLEYQPCSLNNCVEDFNVVMLSSLLETDFETYQMAKECYIQAFNDGIYEAGNNLGILANNEDNLEEALNFFMQAAHNGSHNAMQNYFCLLWGNNEYEKATKFLLGVRSFQSPSARCLYNLSILYMSGDMIKGNILEKNIDLAKEILNKIVKNENIQFMDEDFDKIYDSSIDILKILNSTNKYSLLGAEFHHFLKNIQSDNPIIENYNNKVSAILDKLNLNGELQIRFANAEKYDDNSWFYFKEDEEKSIDHLSWDVIHMLFERIEAKCDTMSVWQIYLLYTSWTILPLFGHACYNKRTYMFFKEDLDKISKNNDIDSITEQNDILPEIKIEGDTAWVTCCYWSDWKGLVRETITINFVEGRRFHINEEVKKEFLYSYHCGIYF